MNSSNEKYICAAESEIRSDGTKIYYHIRNESNFPLPITTSPVHTHSYYELVCVKGGVAELRLASNERLKMNDGDIAIVAPEVAHTMHYPAQTVEKISQYLIKFSPQFLYPLYPLNSDIQYLLQPLQLTSPYLIVRNGSPEYGELHSLVMQVIDLYGKRKDKCEIPLRAYFLLIYDYFIRNIMSDANRSPIQTETEKTNADMIGFVIDYIDKHFGEAVSMQQLAKRCNVNYSYFSVLFQKYTNQSFRDYLIHIRIEKAQEMLLHTSKSVTAVAIDCGFDNISHFIKKFRELTGMTPKVFRKNYQHVSNGVPDGNILYIPSDSEK